MIIFLSGDGKYSIEGTNLENVLESGRHLYTLLKVGNYEEFSQSLEKLHSFVKTNGRKVEILRNADIIVPPTDCDPRVLRTVMGFHGNP